ncbi:hypothetical protein ABIA38_008878 [Embleya sp. AB8]
MKRRIPGGFRSLVRRAIRRASPVAQPRQGVGVAGRDRSPQRADPQRRGLALGQPPVGALALVVVDHLARGGGVRDRHPVRAMSRAPRVHRPPDAGGRVVGHDQVGDVSAQGRPGSGQRDPGRRTTGPIQGRRAPPIERLPVPCVRADRLPRAPAQDASDRLVGQLEVGRAIRGDNLGLHQRPTTRGEFGVAHRAPPRCPWEPAKLGGDNATCRHRARRPALAFPARRAGTERASADTESSFLPGRGGTSRDADSSHPPPGLRLGSTSTRIVRTPIDHSTVQVR